MNKIDYLVVGLGKTGQSIVRYLQRKNKSFAVFDTRTDLSIIEFQKTYPDVPIYLGQIPDSSFNEMKTLILSPGVDLGENIIQAAFDKGLEVIGDVACFAREITAPVIAITGTNGKSTVTTLVGDMAKAAGLNVAVAGNIGLPVLDLLESAVKFDLYVLELSSFQLELIDSLNPLAATILNISPDHLDRHLTMESYIAAKQRVYSGAKYKIYNHEDHLTKPITGVTKTHGDSHEIYFSSDFPEEGQWGLSLIDEVYYLAYGSLLVMPVDKLKIKGRHNWLNALAAAALAAAAGIPLAAIIDVLAYFPGLTHRTQWIRTLNQVDWINDSKGTNVGATLSALNGMGEGLKGKIVLIAGGQGKNAEFTLLREAVRKYVRILILIGEDAPILAKDLSQMAEMIFADNLHHAVILAAEQAKAGDLVLLSPACASFDMFHDFNHRGQCFIEEVLQL